MASSPEKRLETQRIYDGKVVHLRVDTIELPSGNLTKREVVEHGGAVAIVPVLGDGRIALIRQWRTAADEYLLELPAGGLEKGEEPEACARRELIEEIGYEMGRVTPLFSVFLAPGYSSELIHIFLGEELREVGAQPEEDEDLEFVPLSLDEALQKIDEGQIRDAKTVAGLLALQRMRS